MGFLDTVEKAALLLERNGRVSLRVLRREFSVEGEVLDDLVAELVEQGVARLDGNVLVRAGSEKIDESSTQAMQAPPSESAASPSGAFDSGERRQLTVMFCDIVDSTELSQRIDPEELSAIIRAYRSVCVEATKRYDGHVAQYLGDGVMIYFGYPQAHEDDAGRSLRAGLEIQNALKERPRDTQLKARIGIHTGLVVVDPTATGDDTLALGPTSNIAARIQAMAQPGGVVVSDATLALCRGLFATKSLGEPELKGVDEPILLHEVERIVGIRSTRMSSMATQSPMLGRDRELGLLLDRWEEVEEGRGQVVLISGDPGMGKTRLLQALHDSFEDVPHLWQDVHCSPFTAGTAFQPIVELIRNSLAADPTDSGEESSGRFVQWLESLPGLPCEKVIPYLLPLLSLPESDRYPLMVTSPEEQRERTLTALVQLNLTLSEHQPVVFVVEDLHWSDPSTRSFLSRMVEQTPTARIMLILTFRPEFRAPWRQSHVSELKLARLSGRMTREMITNAANGSLPEPVLREIELRSDGVPLFAKELATGVLTSSVMTEQAGRYQLSGSIKDLAIPATLQDSLMARLDRLSVSKRVAQQAATLGREFSYELIEAVSHFDVPSLRKALEQLEDAEIVHRRGAPPDADYTFKHALLQDTAYGSQLMSTRKALHAKIAAVLEDRFPIRAEAEPEMMARHFAAAGAHERAVDYFDRAGAQAVARLSNEEALKHHGQSLETLALLPESSERNQKEIVIRLAQMQSLVVLRGYGASDVISTYARIESLCASLETGPEQLVGLIGLVRFDSSHRGDPVSARDRGELILRISEPLGVAELLVLGHFIVGSSILSGGPSVVQSEERIAEALRIARSVDLPAPATAFDADLIALGHAVHAIALGACGRTDEAMDAVSQARERLNRIDHAFSSISALCTLGSFGLTMYEPELCRSNADEALRLAEGRGFHTQEVVAKIQRGWGRACLGEIDEGVIDVEQALALAESTGSAVGGALLYVAAADVYRMARDWERSEALLELAEEFCEGYPVSGAPLSFVRGQISLESKDNGLDEAEAFFTDAFERADQLDIPMWALIYSTQLGQLALDTGKVEEAYDRLVHHYSNLPQGLEREPALEAKVVIDELAAHLETQPSG